MRRANASAEPPLQAVTPKSGSPSPYRWAMVLARVDEVFPFLCSRCGEPMRIIAFVTELGAVQRILKPLDEPTHPPRLALAAVHPAGTRTSIRAKAICSP